MRSGQISEVCWETRLVQWNTCSWLCFCESLERQHQLWWEQISVTAGVGVGGGWLQKRHLWGETRVWCYCHVCTCCRGLTTGPQCLHFLFPWVRPNNAYLKWKKKKKTFRNGWISLRNFRSSPCELLCSETLSTVLQGQLARAQSYSLLLLWDTFHPSFRLHSMV